MEPRVIKSKINDLWLDASAQWKDEYASRFQIAVIGELENTLNSINCLYAQLRDSINDTLDGLREFEN